MCWVSGISVVASSPEGVLPLEMVSAGNKLVMKYRQV
jgi:hypothetical protein